MTTSPANSPTTQKTSRNASGATLITFAVALMALQDALIKLMSTDLPLGQIFLLRSLLVLPVLTLMARQDWKAVWLQALGSGPLQRGLFLTLMYLALYAVMPYLPLATLAAGFYTGPLFITLLAALVLKEPSGPRARMAVAIGFLGVLVLLRPGSQSFVPAALVPILSGFFYALAAILARGKCRTQSPLSLAISLYLTLFLAGAALLLTGEFAAPINGGKFLLGAWKEMEAADWQLVAMLSLLAVGIGIGLAAAYQRAAPTVVASFDYSYLIFAALFGYLFFAETPDLPTLTGMMMIAGAGFLAITRN